MASSDACVLLEKYRETRDINLRNEIVLRYIDTVNIAVGTFRNAFEKYGDTEDIVNEGVIALIKTVETFKAERGVKFETYANIKIKGAVIDYVRKQDWIPKNVRKFGKDLDAAYNFLYNKFGRQPKNQEIADFMEIPIGKLEKGMADIAGTATLSFEELLYEDNFTHSENCDNEADQNIYQQELKKIISEAIDSLKPKQKQVITLYYYEKLKFNEIAKVLNVTESRICQIHSKSMLLLKRKLEEYIHAI